jgi:hypothetical protein
MKRWLLLFFTFLSGAAVASLGWGWYLFRLQAEVVPAAISYRAGMSDFGQEVLSYMESPDALKARRIEFTASNMVALFPEYVDTWDAEFPYMQIRSRMKRSTQRAEEFLRQRRETRSTNTATKAER